MAGEFQTSSAYKFWAPGMRKSQPPTEHEFKSLSGARCFFLPNLCGRNAPSYPAKSFAMHDCFKNSHFIGRQILYRKIRITLRTLSTHVGHHFSPDGKGVVPFHLPSMPHRRCQLFSQLLKQCPAAKLINYTLPILISIFFRRFIWTLGPNYATFMISPTPRRLLKLETRNRVRP